MIDPPIGFAEGGARAHEDDHSTEAFTLAVKLGATGLDAVAWAGAGGEVVLHPTGSVRAGIRRRAVAELAAADLPPRVPTLAAIYEACGTGVHVSLDVRDPSVVDLAVATARTAGDDAVERLWLCTGEREEAASWRERAGGARIVHVTRLRHLKKEGTERAAARTRDAGVDALRMPYDDWTSGFTTLFHRFGCLAFGSAAVHDRQFEALLTMGIDGLVSGYVDRMVDAIAAAT